ncbi:hypothetical protein AB0E63_23305 [Kribbella sp. NPDC026596]|uniref:hypothetical protein n=1 Tax=Kribbella sp. NPDC026596 TaxID=3155122 RepID=UPI0033ED5A64
MTDNADGDPHPAAVGVVEGRRVRVWFGDHVVADYRAEAELAERYAAAMSRRFAGLRVTSDPIPDADPGPVRKLPGERLWEVAPK